MDNIFDSVSSNGGIIADKAIDTFLSTIDNISTLESKEDAGGWCWYYAMKFEEFLDKAGIDNEIWYYNSKSKGQHFVNYLIDDDVTVDFTYNQIESPTDIPFITKKYNK